MALKRKATTGLSIKAYAFSVDVLLGKKNKFNYPKESDDEDENEVTAEGNDNILSAPKAQISKACLPSPDSTTDKVVVIPDPRIRVELYQQDLWADFHAIGTEMIITKAGRRMFPSLKVNVSGLDPISHYIIFMDIVSLDDKRYRYFYQCSQWTVAGNGDPLSGTNIYIHPDSPATGKQWLNQVVIGFDKVKLTNNRKPLVKGQVSLHSMQRYQTRIHIQKVEDSNGDPEKMVNLKQAMTFVFPETSFITVTAYQNQQITKLKIASNPFAKGFREAGKNRSGLEALMASYGLPIYGNKTEPLLKEDSDHMPTILSTDDGPPIKHLVQPYQSLYSPYTSIENSRFLSMKLSPPLFSKVSHSNIGESGFDDLHKDYVPSLARTSPSAFKSMCEVYYTPWRAYTHHPMTYSSQFVGHHSQDFQDKVPYVSELQIHV